MIMPADVKNMLRRCGRLKIQALLLDSANHLEQQLQGFLGLCPPAHSEQANSYLGRLGGLAVRNDEWLAV